MIIRKTERYYRRKVASEFLFSKNFNETVLRKTWWLFYIIPVFSSEEIVKSQIVS